MNMGLTMNSELKNSMLKTGTTIFGIVCKDGVIMAADRQTTAGHIIMNKHKEKAVQLNDYLVFSACGLAAASDRIKKILPAELKLKELRSKSRPSVRESANLLSSIVYSTIRQPSMVPDEMGALIAGFNEDGSTELYTIDPAGSIHKVEDYDANFGSGMPFILGLLERQFKKDMSVEEGAKLAVEAIKSSTQRDTGSGFGIDVFTITSQGIKKVVSQEIQPSFKED
jgi:proteasome beta subunit